MLGYLVVIEIHPTDLNPSIVVRTLQETSDVMFEPTV